MKPTPTPTTDNPARSVLSNHPRLRVGRRFGHLTVIGQPFYVREKQRRTLCVCECDCGEYTVVRADKLLKGETKSCGCHRGHEFEKRQPPKPRAIKPSPGAEGISKTDLLEFYRTRYATRLAAKGVTPGTVDDYKVALREAPDFLSLDTLTTWLAKSTGAPGTKNHKLRCLLAVLRAARRQELFKGLWLEDVPVAATVQKVPRAWTGEEFAQLLAAADTLQESYFKIPAPRWWRAFLLGSWYTGARLHTLLTAYREGFDPRDGTLLLYSPKDHAEILYTLPPDAVAAIGAMNHHLRRLFPWPHDDWKKTLLKRMRLLIDQAGLPQLHQPFHAIRRSVASYIAAERGVHAAAEALHHCRAQITRDHYLDPRIVQPKVSAGSIMPRPGGKAVQP